MGEPLLDVQTTDLPRFFSLSFAEKSAALVVGVDSNLVPKLQEYLGRTRFVEAYIKTFKLRGFTPTLATGFGFEGNKSLAAKRDGQLEITFPLRRANPFILAASLGVLLTTLHAIPALGLIGGNNIPPKRIQLMSLYPTLRPTPTWGAAMSGDAAPALIRWIRNNHGKHEAAVAVTQAMRVAYMTITKCPRNMCEPIRFVAQSRGSFYITCPGNACDFGVPPDGLWNDGWGGSLSCHNLDTSTQQLTHIAGMAKLHELAAKDLDAPA